MGNELFLPIIMILLLAVAACRKVPMYDLFVKGAREGLETAIQVLPNLTAMLCSISMMQSSGLMERFCALFSPVIRGLGLPAETAPLVFLRPLSGSASLAMLESILNTYGADSRTGLIASTIMGSSETIFYTVCVYMSAVSDKRTGYAVPCALTGALAAACTAGILF